MSGDVLGPGPHTKVHRLPEKARYEESAIDAILDEARLCHVAANVDGLAMVLPTLHAREGRTLYLHGSRSNAVMKSIVAAGTACVTATLYDGLRLARSGFESSIAYRSVVVVGATRLIEDEAERSRILDMFVDSILPGRAGEVRPMTEREQRLTMVVAIAMDEASAKVSSGPTDDFEEDLDLPIWSGVIPARLEFGTPVASTDGAMATGDIPLPLSVQRLFEQRR